MKFSQVKRIIVPEGVTDTIKFNGKTLWECTKFPYVSLGDSIAAGHSIYGDWESKYGERSQYGVNGNTETQIVSKSYTDLIRQDMVNTYGLDYTSTISFARSGDRVQELISKLDHDVVKKAISKAKYVTVCIGANNVLEPAFSHLEEYITAGSLENAEAAIENNFSILSNDNNNNSYKALFDKLVSINPNANYVFTTIYNPYKYLHLDEGQNGFFSTLINLIPSMNIDIDGIISNMTGGWIPLPDLDYDIAPLIREGILNTPIFQLVFDRFNNVGSWSEKYVNRLNTILSEKITNYKSTNPNFYIAETKKLFDSYPNRGASANIYYHDLVNVEYTSNYRLSDMAWGELWHDNYGDSAEGVTQYWIDLAWNHISFSNAFPSYNPLDYFSFDMAGFAVDLMDQILNKVIIPDIDPHPEEYGHAVLKTAFKNAKDFTKL